jgi:hypothetical protein
MKRSHSRVGRTPRASLGAGSWARGCRRRLRRRAPLEDDGGAVRRRDGCADRTKQGGCRIGRQEPSDTRRRRITPGWLWASASPLPLGTDGRQPGLGCGSQSASCFARLATTAELRIQRHRTIEESDSNVDATDRHSARLPGSHRGSRTHARDVMWWWRLLGQIRRARRTALSG